MSLLLLLFGTFLPSLVALIRKHRHFFPIFIINLFMLICLVVPVAMNLKEASQGALGLAMLVGVVFLFEVPFWIGTLAWSVWPQTPPVIHARVEPAPPLRVGHESLRLAESSRRSPGLPGKYDGEWGG